jgi:hypothetical protein
MSLKGSYTLTERMYLCPYVGANSETKHASSCGPEFFVRSSYETRFISDSTSLGTS